MLLVNFSYMLLVLNCWCKHVLEYVGVDLLKSYEICFVVVESWVHTQSLSDFISMFGGEYFCIQLCRVIMMFSWHQGRRPRR